jgi:hypothetical protein
MTSSNGLTRAEFWQELVTEHAQSHLSVRAFCASKNVSVPSFYQWRRKLLLAAEPAATRSVESRSVPMKGSRNGRRQTFVPIRLVSDHEATVESSRTIQIFTPCGFTLRVATNTAPSDLTRLLRAVEDASRRGEPC